MASSATISVILAAYQEAKHKHYTDHDVAKHIARAIEHSGRRIFEVPSTDLGRPAAPIVTRRA